MVSKYNNYCSNNNFFSIGGKAFNLGILNNAGFNIPNTYIFDLNSLEKVNELDSNINYIVRSSSPTEDSYNKTGAGMFNSVHNISIKDLKNNIKSVANQYKGGSVVVQPDISNEMDYSGVVYSNLNGEIMISMGKKNQVQNIVNQECSDYEISIKEKNIKINCLDKNNIILNPNIINLVKNNVLNAENYFGFPIDVEFAINKNNEFIFLQTRPIPNPTIKTIKNHELRKIRNLVSINGLEEIVLGSGNYREILGDDKATLLSCSTFNYVMSGDGKNVLGAMQLGRNELGYDVGFELFPIVTMFGDKIYYNFAGDALQFRPRGIELSEIINLINNYYLPLCRSEPDLLNYPELRLYVQFPEIAEKLGLNPKPFEELVKKNRNEINNLEFEKWVPINNNYVEHLNYDYIFDDTKNKIEKIRTNSGKDYVKAARLAFFALEDLRFSLINLKKNNLKEYEKLSSTFKTTSSTKLRDAIAYDQSIQFQLKKNCNYNYIGSFELSLPRNTINRRPFKKGRIISNEIIKDKTNNLRKVLENREFVKFKLLVDFAYLKNCYENIGRLSGINNDIYFLNMSEIDLINNKVDLVKQKIDFNKKILNTKNMFSDPFFEINKVKKNNSPKLIFGNLNENSYSFKDLFFVNAVDQTINIPENSKIIIVKDNIKPGSHLFTLLSDYDMAVINVDSNNFNKIKNSKKIDILNKGDENIEILFN